jgi:hypothetical protein
MTRTLGWTLLHFVWQGAAVASVLACLNLTLRRSAPQARYLLACGSLLLMLVLPALTFRVLSAAPATAPSSTGAIALAAHAAADGATTSPSWRSPPWITASSRSCPASSRFGARGCCYCACARSAA